MKYSYRILPVLTLLTFHGCSPKQLDEDRKNLSKESFENQLRSVTSQESSVVRLYDTLDTDTLLNKLSNDSGVSRIDLILTDVSPIGIESLQGLTGLQTLHIYGGTHGINLDVMRNISKIHSLVCLELINPSVGPQPIISTCRSLPNLRELRVQTGNGNFGFSQETLLKLAEIDHLTTIAISGDWTDGVDFDRLSKFSGKRVHYWDRSNRSMVSSGSE